MKRVAFHIGASCALALVFSNIFGARASQYICIAAGIVFVLSLSFKRIRQALVLPIVTCSVMLSCLLFVFVWNNTVVPIQSLDSQRLYCTFQICDKAEKTGAGYKYTVNVSSVQKPNAPQDFKTIVFSTQELDANYYDNVSAYLNFEKEYENGFDSFGDFGNNIFIKSHTDFQGLEYTVSENKRKPVNYAFIKLREKIKKNTAYVTEGDEGRLALAFLIGEKDELPRNITSNFKACGVYHVMAVSGLHTSLICLGLYWLLKRIGVPLPVNTFITFLALLSYCTVSDFSSSVIRSVITVSAYIFSKLINRKSDLLNSLGVSMTILCLNPFSVTDSSAVLTVCSVLGITIIYPQFLKMRFKEDYFQVLYNAFSLTFSVTLAVLPASLIFFDSLSVVSLVLNIVIIPLSEILLVAVLFYNILSFWSPLAFLPKLMMIWLSKMVLTITDFFAQRLAFLYLDLSDRMFLILCAVCFLWLSVSILILKKVSFKGFLAFVLSVFLIFGGIFIKTDKDKIYLNVSYSNCICVYDRKNLLVFDADSSDDYYYIKRICELRKFDKAVLVNSDYDKAIISKMLDCDTAFYSGEKTNVDLWGNVDVKYHKEYMQLSIYNKQVNIYSEFVFVGNYKAYRNVSDNFSDEKNYVFAFSKNADVKVRREKDG